MIDGVLVGVIVGVIVGVMDIEGVTDGVAVIDGVAVLVGVTELVGVGVGVSETGMQFGPKATILNSTFAEDNVFLSTQ